MKKTIKLQRLTEQKDYNGCEFMQHKKQGHFFAYEKASKDVDQSLEAFFSML